MWLVDHTDKILIYYRGQSPLAPRPHSTAVYYAIGITVCFNLRLCVILWGANKAIKYERCCLTRFIPQPIMLESCWCNADESIMTSRFCFPFQPYANSPSFHRRISAPVEDWLIMMILFIFDWWINGILVSLIGITVTVRCNSTTLMTSITHLGISLKVYFIEGGIKWISKIPYTPTMIRQSLMRSALEYKLIEINTLVYVPRQILLPRCLVHYVCIS